MSAAAKRAAIARLFTGYLDPLLSSLEFARKERVYRRYNSEGDALIVDFQTASGSTAHRYAFFVDVALVPSVWLRWMRHDDEGEGGEPDAGEALVQTRLEPAPTDVWTDIEPGVRMVIPGRTDWYVDSVESADLLGQEISERVSEAVRPYLELLDRRVFLERLSGGPKLPGTCPKLAARAVLLLETGEREELDSVLDAIEARTPDSRFVRWVRQQSSAAHSG